MSSVSLSLRLSIRASRHLSSYLFIYFFFFFNDTATTEIYTLSLHDALPIFANYVNDAGAGNLDDVAGMNQRIAARIIGLEKILQVHLHDIFGCGSIAVEVRLHLLHPDGVLCSGTRLIRCTGTIYGPFWFCGQSCASQNDDAFSRIVGQAFRKRENLKQRLASTDLENAWPSHRP